MKAIFFLIKLGGWPFVGSGLLSLVAGMSSGYAIKLINEAIHNGIQDPKYFFISVIGSLVVFIASSVIASNAIIRILQNIVTSLTRDFAVKILKAPYIETEANQEKLMSVFFHDINTISNLTEKIPNFFVSSTVVMVVSGYIYYLSKELFIALLAMIILVGISVILTNKPLRRVAFINRKIFDTYFQKVKHVIYGIRELKLNTKHHQHFIEKELAETLENKRFHTVKERVIITTTDKIVESMALACIAVIVYILTYYTNTNRESFVEGFTMTLFLAAPLASIASFAKGLKTFNAAIRQISSLGLDLEKSVSKSKSSFASVKLFDPIILKDIGFTYPKKKEAAIEKVNLTIEPGSINFITGGNGSGKTTLGKIITGLYLPDKGSIAFNNKQLGSHNLDEYRDLFTAIWNDNYLFEDIRYTEWEKHDWQKKLQDLDLDKHVGIENGVYSNMKLSSGQQKRLAYLTSLLEDKPVWFFDEWAAYQDSHFKKLFYRSILPYLKSTGKTIIAITHDDQYFEIADQVVEIKNGCKL